VIVMILVVPAGAAFPHIAALGSGHRRLPTVQQVGACFAVFNPSAMLSTAREAIRSWRDERPTHRGGQQTPVLFEPPR
jgi:hypothetical protein